MREKTTFCIYGCFNVSRYTKGGRKSHLNSIEFLDTYAWKLTNSKQSKLTKEEKYNIFVEILYSYFRYNGRLFLGCLLFVAPCNIIRFYGKPKRNDWLTEKIHSRICVRDINFLTAGPPFYFIFCCFLHLLLSPSQVT